MKSMTGFGRATAALGAGTLTIQVNSVNRRRAASTWLCEATLVITRETERSMSIAG